METKEQKPSEIFDWLAVEVSAIDCVYRGDPRHDRDAYWMRDEVQRLIEHARKAFPDPDEAPALSVQKQLVEALEGGVALIEGPLVGADWKRACNEFTKSARAAIQAAKASS